jgi:hypothetical protein
MRTLLLITALMLIKISSAQQTYDKKLLAKFDKTYLEQQAKNNPIFIERQNFIVNHSYKIIDADSIPNNIKLKKLQAFDHKQKKAINKEITINDLNNFNIFNYNAKPGKKSNNYYKIGNTGKILVVYSVQKQTKLFNSNRKAQN